jgi:hypothetical protein
MPQFDYRLDGTAASETIVICQLKLPLTEQAVVRTSELNIYKLHIFKVLP